MSKLLTIIGPTASGKTALAVKLANTLDGEIISVDSRQIYKGMDIGTGKDLSEYKNIPYHLIDICNTGEKYNLFRYLEDAHKALELIYLKQKTPILCGGTGLYAQALLEGYKLTDIPENQELRNELVELDTKTLLKLSGKSNETSRKRLIRAIEKKQHIEQGLSYTETSYPPKKALVIGLLTDIEERRKKISARLSKRFDEGMLEEVKSLLNQGTTPEQLIWYGLEYKFITQHLQGTLSYDEMFSRLEVGIHQFAKRQMTYFRKMEKDGIKVHWFHPEEAYKKTLQQYE